MGVVLCQCFIPFHEQIIFHCADGPYFVHSSVDGHLGCFHLLALVDNAFTNICVQCSFLSEYPFSVLWGEGHILRGKAGFSASLMCSWCLGKREPSPASGSQGLWVPGKVGLMWRTGRWFETHQNLPSCSSSLRTQLHPPGVLGSEEVLAPRVPG